MAYGNSTNISYNKSKIKPLKVNDNKLKKKHLKNKEKIERSSKVKNISRRGRIKKITQEEVSKYYNNSYRLKKKKPCKLKINERHKYMFKKYGFRSAGSPNKNMIKYIKTTEKVKVNQKALKPPKTYKKECVVCI